METFSVFLTKIGLDSQNAQGEFKTSLIEILCIEEEEAEEIIHNIPGLIEADLVEPAAEALADMLRSIGGIVEVKNTLEELQTLDTPDPDPDLSGNQIKLDEPESPNDSPKEIRKPLELSPDMGHSEHFSFEETGNESFQTSPETSDDDHDSNKGGYDFDFSGLTLEGEDEDENSETGSAQNRKNTIPEMDTPLSHVIKNDDESLLDLALAFEESQEKSGSVPLVKKENGTASTDTSGIGLNLQMDDEAGKDLKTDAKTLPDKKNTIQQTRSDSQVPDASSQPPESGRTDNKAQVSDIEVTTEIADDETILREKVISRQVGKPQYSIFALGIFFILLVMYLLMPSAPEPKNTSTISPEVIKQLLNAQKRDKTKNVKATEEVPAPEKKLFESHISNKIWDMKTRVESKDGKIHNLDVEFGVKKVPLPAPEEYISKKFIPQMVTMGITFRNAGKTDSLSARITTPARIYTKIGTRRKRFTVPLTVELNEAGKVLTIFSDNNYEGIPPGTYSIDPAEENPDSINARLYFIIPLKEQVFKEIISKDDESEVSNKK